MQPRLALTSSAVCVYVCLSSQNSQASEAETVQRSLSATSTSVVSKSYSVVPLQHVALDVHRKSTEHRWGSCPQALCRSKKITKVVRPESTPPVLPGFIQQELEQGDHLQRDTERASSADMQSAVAELMSRLSSTEDLSPEVSNTGHTLLESIYSPDDTTPATPLYSFMSLDENFGRELEQHDPMPGMGDGLEHGCGSGQHGSDVRETALPKTGVRPATSAGIGQSSRALLHKEMLKESEVFGLLLHRDAQAKQLHDVGVAAKHAKDYHKSSSFGSPKHGEGVFSRPARRESSPVVPARMSGHLADASLLGEHKVLTAARPESPSKRGASVKPKPKAGLKTLERELMERRRSPPPSERRPSLKSKFHSALYVDVLAANSDEVSEATVGGWRVAPLDPSREAGEEQAAGLIAIFPPTPQLRSELSQRGMGEFNSPSVGRGESEVVLQHLRDLDLANKLQRLAMGESGSNQALGALKGNISQCPSLQGSPGLEEISDVAEQYANVSSERDRLGPLQINGQGVSAHVPKPEAGLSAKNDVSDGYSHVDDSEHGAPVVNDSQVLQIVAESPQERIQVHLAIFCTAANSVCDQCAHSQMRRHGTRDHQPHADQSSDMKFHLQSAPARQQRQHQKVSRSRTLQLFQHLALAASFL